MRATEFVNEEINPDILNTKFKHKQVIGDYTLSSETVRLPTGPLMLQIKAFIGDKYIGKADFYIGVRSETLHSGLTTVDPAYKKQGVATAMYAYAKMLGNDIVPSVQQLAPGKKMWAAWKKSGEAKHLMPANESQTAKTGIMQTDVYGSRAYHARCLEPGCDWESRRYDRIQQAQAAAKKHAATHFDKKAVAEAFDQPYKLKWEKSDYGDYDALAKLDDGTFLSIMFNNEYKKNWMVEFYRNNSQAVTGEGDAPRIFATVLHAIAQFIKKKKPASIFFSAVKEDDPTGSRAKLYDRLVQRYASGLGYTVQKQEQPGSVSFKLVQTQPVEENFADGRKPGRKGLAKRVGVDCKQPVSKLRKIAKNSSGERQRMAHWCANMKAGRAKKK
jgi:hypothetical protein